MNKETCNICPDKHCINSNSRMGRVRAVIDNETKELIDAPKVLIEDCPIRLKEKDDIEDRRNY